MGYDIIVIFGSPYIDLSGTILEQRYKKILLKAYNEFREFFNMKQYGFPFVV